MSRDSNSSGGCGEWFKWLVGIVIALLAAGGGIVALLNYFNPPRPPATFAPPSTLAHYTINYSQRGGPFLILGPNPGGRWASEGNWWHMMDILVENRCSEPIYISADRFRLYLSSNSTIENAESFRPTTIGIENLAEPLGAKWVEPNSTISGRVIFEVPETLQNGTASNGVFHILRYANESSCQPEYKPY